MRKQTVRLTVTFPADLAMELRELVPKRGRSKLVAEAVREKLIQLRQEMVRGEKTASRPGEEHPELQTPDDVMQLLRDLRRSVREQLDRPREDE